MRIYTDPILHKHWKPKYYLLCIPVLALLFWAPPSVSADVQTLERIAEAEDSVGYVGVRLKTFISSRGTRTFEELVIHSAPGTAYGKELSAVGERRSFGSSRGQDNDPRRDNRRRPRNESHRSTRERPHEQSKWKPIRNLFSKKEIALIAKNYNLETTASTEKISNYETDLLTITPKFAGRPTQRIFFARENGVILRVERLDPDGVLRAMFVYTRISFDPEAIARKAESLKSEITPEPQRSYPIALADSVKILKTKPIQPEYLPPGFQLQEVHAIKGKENTIHLIYTDGLLGFSIFETTDKPARRGSRRTEDVKVIEDVSVHERKRGATHSFSWSSADIHFFLFGAMPPVEMEKVVKSLIHTSKNTE